MRIRISVGKLSMEAELNDTPTARKVAEVLPLCDVLQHVG